MSSLPLCLEKMSTCATSHCEHEMVSSIERTVRSVVVVQSNATRSGHDRRAHFRNPRRTQHVLMFEMFPKSTKLACLCNVGVGQLVARRLACLGKHIEPWSESVPWLRPSQRQPKQCAPKKTSRFLKRHRRNLRWSPLDDRQAQDALGHVHRHPA